jgi:hypothetical protein
MAKRTKAGLTHIQHMNVMEWFKRMREDKGIDMREATIIFNGLTAMQQHKIYTKTWYNVSSGKRIKRALIPE